MEFDSSVSLKCVAAKVSWVHEDQEDIINYENNKLVAKASEKIAFVSLCMEYKRYVEFLQSSTETSFYSYLPVRLDATCNGFQHMALLSNEYGLFEKLNFKVGGTFFIDIPT